MHFPKAGDGFWGDVTHGGRKLRVFSEVTAVGEVAAVYDLDAKAWVTREWADSLQDAQQRVEALVQELLPGAPPIEWKERP